MTEEQLMTVINELSSLGDPRFNRKVYGVRGWEKNRVPHIPPFSVYEHEKAKPDNFHGFYNRAPRTIHSITAVDGSALSMPTPEVELMGFRDRLHLENLRSHLRHLGKFYLSPVVSHNLLVEA